MKRKYASILPKWPIRTLIHGIFLCIFLKAAPLQAQQILETYIQEGLANNLVLKEKNASLDQS